MLSPLLALFACSPLAAWGGAHGPPPIPPPPPVGYPTGAPSAGAGGAAPSGKSGPSTGTGTGAGTAHTTPTRPTGDSQPTPASTGRPNLPAAGTAAATAAVSSGVDLTTWEYWWLYNKDAYLQVKAHIDAAEPRSGEDAALRAQRAWDEAVERVLPQVQAALDLELDVDPILASMIAMARACDGQARVLAESIARECRERRRSSNRAVAEASIMALGILGHDASVFDLCALLLDEQAARQTLGGKAVPERMRAFAGLSLGLLGARTGNEDVRRFAVHHLVRQLRSETGAQPDTQAACVLALGLIPLADRGEDARGAPNVAGDVPSASLDGELDLLARLLGDTSAPIYVRAHVPKSLANLARAPRLRESALRTLLARIADRGERGEVVLGCIQALGELGETSPAKIDADVREALARQFASGETQARCFSTMALAQIGTRGDDAPGVEAIRALLRASMVTGRSTRERSWSALALGVLERGRLGRESVPKESAIGLAGGLRHARSPEEVGAFAIACGLARVGDATPVLLDQLGSVKEPRAQGYVALALGMIQSRDALEPLHELLEESRVCSEKLPQAALALALLEDPSIVTRLLALLEEGSSQSTKQAAATALGAAGDRRALPALLDLLQDRTSIASTRGAAVAAIGRVCDRDPLPWQHGVSEGLNYRAMTVTLSDEGHSGLLDLK